MMLVNPLVGAFFQLAGGWRQNSYIVGGFLALVGVTLGSAYSRAGPNDRAEIAGLFLVLISIVQGVLLLMAAPEAIRKAVQRDFQTGMLESHRLTPLSGLTLASGYLFGATAQAALLYGGGLLAGGFIASLYGQALGIPLVTVGVWYAGQFGLLPLTLLIGLLVLHSALATGGKMHLLVLLSVVSILGGWIALPLVPGLALVSGALGAGLVGQFLARVTTPGGDPRVLGWQVLFHIALSAVLLAAACRKVRRPERPGFTMLLGLLLVGIWGAALVVGALVFAPFRPLFESVERSWTVVGSTVAFLLVAIVPLLAAAAARTDHERGPAAGLRGRVADLVPWLLAAGAAVLWVVLSRAVEASGWLSVATELALITVAFAASCWLDYVALRWARLCERGVLLPLLVTWLGLRGLPLLVTGIVAMVAAARDADAASPWLMAFSPIGTLVAVADERVRLGVSEIVTGVAVQVLLAIIGAVVVAATRAAVLARETRERDSAAAALRTAGAETR
jgi:hypothetical protein